MTVKKLLIVSITLALTASLSFGAHALSVSEPPDFSNTYPGTAYELPAGTHTFSGTVTTPSDGQDNFQVTIPAGHQLTAVSKNVSGGSFNGFVTFNLNETFVGEGAASFSEGLPLGPGTYAVQIVANFSTGSSWSMSFTVESIGNSAPTGLSLSNASVLENEPPNTVVGTLSTTDPNPSDTFTYSLVAGSGSTDNGSFNILGSSLRTSIVFDYETKTSYSIRVRTTDQGGLSFERSFTISVVDVNDNLPIITPGQTRQVDQGAANGTHVGAPIHASDADAGAILGGWQITGGNTGGAFSIDASSGQLSVASSAALDPSETPSFTLSLTVSDGVFTSAPETVLVQVIPDCGEITVTPDALASVAIGEAIEATEMVAEGAVGEVTWGLNGDLPSGVTFEDGLFTGTPEEAGQFDLEVTASDSLGCFGSTIVGLVVSCGASVGGGQQVCGPTASLPLGGTLPSEGTAGVWSDGGAGGAFSPDGSAPDATYTPPAELTGDIELTFTVTGAGCESTAPLTLTVTVLDPAEGECCVSAADCDDADECTIDACQGGVCSHEPDPACGTPDGGVGHDGGLEPDGGEIAPPSDGCGCSATGESASPAPLALIALLAAAYFTFRRRLYR
jgi:MYXO-CTERM domain-containing protein